jgi:hypothetical protein
MFDQKNPQQNKNIFPALLSTSPKNTSESSPRYPGEFFPMPEITRNKANNLQVLNVNATLLG